MKAAMNIFLFKHLLNQLKGVNLGIKKKVQDLLDFRIQFTYNSAMVSGTKEPSFPIT